MHNTIKFYSEVYCKSTETKPFIFKDLKTAGAFYRHAGINVSDLNERFYQGVLDGEMGECTILAGYFYNLLKNAQIECYSVDIKYADDTKNHNFVIYKPTTNSETWYVLPCGLRLSEKNGKDITLDKLTLEYYLNSIKNFCKLYSLYITPPKSDQTLEGVTLWDRLKLPINNPFLGISKMMTYHLIPVYKKMFDLK